MRREFQFEAKECADNVIYLTESHKLLGNVKLGCIVVVLICLVLILRNLNILLMALGIILVQLYILLSVIQIKTEKRIEENRIKQKIHQDYLDRMDGAWHSFTDKGEEFVKKDHKYTSDIDVFGDNSIFQYLNTTKTWHGRQKFAKDLREANFGTEELKNRQKAVWELSPTKNFTVDFQFYGSKIRFKGEILELINILKGSGKKSISSIYSYLLLLPVFSTAFILAVFFTGLSEFYIPAALLLFTHIALWVFCTVKLSGNLKKITGTGYRIGEYSELFAMMERKTVESPILKDIKSKVKSDKGIVASEAIKKLDRVIMLIDMRRSGMVYFALNIFFLWDFICIYFLRSWQAEYGGYVEGWFEAIGEMESLLSFANLSFVEENCCIPEIVEENLIEAKELGHPLINLSNRVNNNVKLDKEIFIISGSNMSGKTTFLRTVGVNMVLGLGGGYVCAKELKMPNIGISTSMRVVDDLSEGVSTFYAELKRVKNIINDCKGKKTLFLIDEMFRGTNSKDRLEGALAVIKNLESEDSIGLVTTHDLALCDLADNERIKNYNFSEKYENDEIIFNYILNIGKSESTNAKFLMNKLGIEIPEDES
ncbi:MAG: hypothetical protein FWE24_04685 [Defluviitaleaceae bacterium]|nr:hypothetical protein [Defluviitaleaceae bacterium]